MKSIVLSRTIAFLVLCFFIACTAVRGEDQNAAGKIVLGTKYSDASKLLSDGGSKEEERRYSERIDPKYSVHYHPLRNGVDLVATVERASGTISFLSLMTAPAYRPVKGLEVRIPVSEFGLNADGSFSVVVPPAPPGVPANEPVEQAAPSDGEQPPD